MKTSAVKITKKEFNAALVENTTSQIYGRSSTYNRFNDIVAAVNNAETMKNVKDNAEWRTVTKTRANGVTFSNGSTLDYAPNNHENNVNYYRVGNVVIMVAARRNDASDYERNPYIYLIVAYLIDTPETTTMNTETKTMNEVAPVEFSELSHAGQCTDIYLHNTAEIYERYTVKAVKLVVNAFTNQGPVKLDDTTAWDNLKFWISWQPVVKKALQAAVRLVKKYDHMTPTAKDIHEVTRNYTAYIVESAKYEVENA